MAAPVPLADRVWQETRRSALYWLRAVPLFLAVLGPWWHWRDTSPTCLPGKLAPIASETRNGVAAGAIVTGPDILSDALCNVQKSHIAFWGLELG